MNKNIKFFNNMDLSKLILRVSLAIPQLIGIINSWLALQEMGVDATGLKVVSAIAPILIMLGIFCRWAAGFYVITLIIPIVITPMMIHHFDSNMLTNSIIYLGVAFTLMILGSGKYAIRPD